MHMDRVQFSNDQNLYQEKCRLEVQIFAQIADEFLRNTIWASIVSCPWYWNAKHIGEFKLFFILFFLILIMCQYIIIICFICVRDVVKPYKIHTKIIWEFIEALPDFLIWKASELKWNFQLILASSKYACFLALLTHKREFSEWAFRVLVGVYDCLWSAILLSFSINGQMSVELTF